MAVKKMSRRSSKTKKSMKTKSHKTSKRMSKKINRKSKRLSGGAKRRLSKKKSSKRKQNGGSKVITNKIYYQIGGNKFKAQMDAAKSKRDRKVIDLLSAYDTSSDGDFGQHVFQCPDPGKTRKDISAAITLISRDYQDANSNRRQLIREYLSTTDSADAKTAAAKIKLPYVNNVLDTRTLFVQALINQFGN